MRQYVSRAKVAILRSPGLVTLAFVLAAFSWLPQANAEATPNKWQPGDLALGTAPGQWKIYRPSSGAVIDTISDTIGSPGVSSPGTPTSSALDNTWHLLGLDAGAKKIARFRISPHDVTNPSTLVDVLQLFDSSGGTGSSNPVSLTVSRLGHMFVANATSPAIVELDNTGTLVGTPFQISSRNIDRTLAAIDLGTDGTFLLYTSGGPTIRKLVVSGADRGTITTFASIGGERFGALQIVPECAVCTSGIGILAAGRSSISLFDGSGALVKSFAVLATSLAVDPALKNPAGTVLPPAYFWAVSSNSGTVRRVAFADGSTSQFSVPGVSGISSVSQYGTFDANQPIATVFPPFTLTASSATATYFFRGADQLTATGYNLTADFTSTLRAFATSVPQQTGGSDTGLTCTPTISGECTVWELSLDDRLPTGAVISFKVLALQGSTDGNTKLIRNERDDVTTGFRNIDPIGASRLSVYSLNQLAGTDEGCTYFTPIVEGATLKNPGNITFRFRCSGLPGAQLKTLFPRLSIVQLQSGAAPKPYFPDVASLTGGTCCTISNYRYDDASNTWILNVSFSTVNTMSTFLATTFDQNHIASAFDVQFTVQK